MGGERKVESKVGIGLLSVGGKARVGWMMGEWKELFQPCLA
jgi:hypothetical protein